MSVGIFDPAIFDPAIFDCPVAVTGGGGGGGGASVDWSRYRAVSPQQAPAQHFTVRSSGTSISWRVRARGAGTVIHPEPAPLRLPLTVASTGTTIRIRVLALGRGTVDANEEDDELALLGVL